ncbi:MAG: PAS domain-containing protein [Leptolyngbyaceae cyanobacterium RM2_2_4]|nr:PAS domain-containing protein [Leptolyngbyaceae cyanobacterium SM1_4_3]NJO50938.1 PAS domain-containing protein [Leptolyngbyaceae cyanobacterium RM2_2_4]NJO75548.1 PAS domain-containing protein [Leptolyngbyaceae cyanobacterium RM1_406_9]
MSQTDSQTASQTEEHYLKRELYDLIQSDRSIFDFLHQSSLDGIWYWDITSPEHEWMSPGFWQLLGYDPTQKKHLASEWQDLINPDDLKQALLNFELHCRDANHSYDQVVRYRHANGSTVWVRCRGIAIRDQAGNPIRMLGAHNDITNLKAAEETLQKRNIELEQMHQVIATQVIELQQVNKQLQCEVAERQQAESALEELNAQLEARIADQTNQLKQMLLRLQASETQLSRAILNAPFPMIIHAEGGEVLLINHIWTEITGYTRAEIPTLFDWAEKAYGDRKHAVMTAIDRLYQLEGRVDEGEFTIMTKTGDRRIWEFSSSSLGKAPDGRQLVLSMAVDRTFQKQQAEKIQETARQRETLIREIHHRVKNNLQVVSGLLYLQSHQVEDEKTLKILQNSQDRIHSMSLIHEKLYGSANLSQIDFLDYVKSLTQDLWMSHLPVSNRISLSLNLHPVLLNIDTAMRCGLVVNELVSNALKHAFPGEQTGEIQIAFSQVGESLFELVVSDNGIGLTQSLDFSRKKSLGLWLVHSLVTQQMRGSLDVLEPDKGLTFKINFESKNDLILTTN